MELCLSVASQVAMAQIIRSLMLVSPVQSVLRNNAQLKHTSTHVCMGVTTVQSKLVRIPLLCIAELTDAGQAQAENLHTLLASNSTYKSITGNQPTRAIVSPLSR